MTVRASPQTLLDVLNHIAAVTEEARLEFEADAIAVTERDPANVSMVDLTIHADLFETYDPVLTEVHIDVPQTISAVSSLKKQEEFIEDPDPLALEYDDETKKVTLSYGGNSFNLATATVGKTRPKMPEVDYAFSAELDSKWLSYKADICADVSEKVGLEAQNRTFSVTALADDDGFAATLEEDDLSANAISDGIADTLVDANYLKETLAPISGNVTLKVGKSKPILIQSEGGNIEFTYVIAPRIKADDSSASEESESDNEESATEDSSAAAEASAD